MGIDEDRQPRGYGLVSRVSARRALRPLVGVLALTLFSGFVAGSPRYKIQVRDDGVYRVSYEELRAAGGLPEVVPSQRLSLSAGGQPVPLRVEDGCCPPRISSTSTSTG